MTRNTSTRKEKGLATLLRCIHATPARIYPGLSPTAFSGHFGMEYPEAVSLLGQVLRENEKEIDRLREQVGESIKSGREKGGKVEEHGGGVAPSTSLKDDKKSKQQIRRTNNDAKIINQEEEDTHPSTAGWIQDPKEGKDEWTKVSSRRGTKNSNKEPVESIKGGENGSKTTKTKVKKILEEFLKNKLLKAARVTPKEKSSKPAQENKATATTPAPTTQPLFSVDRKQQEKEIAPQAGGGDVGMGNEARQPRDDNKNPQMYLYYLGHRCISILSSESVHADTMHIRETPSNDVVEGYSGQKQESTQIRAVGRQCVNGQLVYRYVVTRGQRKFLAHSKLAITVGCKRHLSTSQLFGIARRTNLDQFPAPRETEEPKIRRPTREVAVKAPSSSWAARVEGRPRPETEDKVTALEEIVRVLTEKVQLLVENHVSNSATDESSSATPPTVV